MAAVFRIHPAIKDAQCRVERQVARLRLVAHRDDNTVQEIASAEADIPCREDGDAFR